MKAFKYAVIALCLLLALPIASQAQTPPAASSAQPMSTGVVKKVDAAQGKITISHGPLANLDMPAMTMLFRVADPKLIESVKAGDNIQFIAEKVNGALTVTRMEQAGAAAAPAVAAPAAVSATAAPPAATAAAAQLQSKGAAMPVPTPVASAQDNGKPGDPANPAETVSGPAYQSAFSDYQAARESTVAPDKIWRAANDEMARLGGHAGQTKEASDGMQMKNMPNKGK
jgi:Cu(I)/Ag(I) efflux system periplasmic protein CusF